MLAIENIEDNEHLEVQGDVLITGSIGKNATVTVENGSLIVNHDIGEDSKIELKSTPRRIKRFFCCSCSKDSTYILNIGGTVGNNTLIKTSNMDIKVTGNTGSGAKLHSINGNIYAGNVAFSASLTTINGNIHVVNDDGALLTTVNGQVFRPNELLSNLPIVSLQSS